MAVLARQWAGSPMISSQQTWSPVVRGPRSGFWKGLGSGKAVPKAIAIPLGDREMDSQPALSFSEEL